MAIEKRMRDLLIILTAAPHTDDTLTSVLRISHALLEQGKSVRVWACGYSTMLTQRSLGDNKPVNERAPDTAHPSSAALVHHLMEHYDRRFDWVGCTACSAERGATEHIRDIRLRSPGRLMATMTAARRTIYIGGV